MLNMSKKLFLIIICLISLIIFSGCDLNFFENVAKPQNEGTVEPEKTDQTQDLEHDPEPVVEEKAYEKVIDEIECLPDKITKEDISQVREVEQMYNALSDADKEEVSNYEILGQALSMADYLEKIEGILSKEFEKVNKLIDEAIPEVITSLEESIDLPTSYYYEDDIQRVKYSISYNISNPEIINTLGEITHQDDDEEVLIVASITCSYTKETKKYYKNVTVERRISTVFSKKLLVAYWYGRYQELTAVDYESIDIINYSFAQIAQDDNGKWYIDGRLDNLKNFASIKEKGIKLCLSLGGWHDDKSFWDIYALASKTKESREAVANAILDVMIKYNLDGIDMDWEYPTSKDKTNYTLLMKQIKETLKAYNPDYLITAAIPAGDWIGSRFDLKALNDALDLFYIMTYDLDDGMNCNHLSSLADAKETVSFFEKSGVSKEKIVIGSAFYGRVYEGVNDNGKGGLGVKASDKDEISFDEIRETYLSRLGKGVTKYYDEENEAYYLYDATNKCFITYEDTESVTDKWNYVLEANIGGLMYWSYNEDKSNTLMKAINAAQNNK